MRFSMLLPLLLLIVSSIFAQDSFSTETVPLDDPLDDRSIIAIVLEMMHKRHQPIVEQIRKREAEIQKILVDKEFDEQLLREKIQSLRQLQDKIRREMDDALIKLARVVSNDREMLPALLHPPAHLDSRRKPRENFRSHPEHERHRKPHPRMEERFPGDRRQIRDHRFQPPHRNRDRGHRPPRRGHHPPKDDSREWPEDDEWEENR